jgi:hypothetical protein
MSLAKTAENRLFFTHVFTGPILKLHYAFSAFSCPSQNIFGINRKKMPIRNILI